MKMYLIRAIVISGLLLVLSACDGGGASTNLNLNMTDFMYDPVNFTVPAGQEITMTASNLGSVEHEYVIFKLGTDAGDKFGEEDEKNIYWEIEVQPGETATETFIAPGEPGEYFVSCGISGHLEAGMVGKLIVVSP
ncbi:MAG: cupredoxin domain-containing protein [Anaerolineales bacterium]